MRKYILAVLVFIGVGLGIYLVSLTRDTCPLSTISPAEKIEPIQKDNSLKDALVLLKNRKDNDALVVFEKILADEPGNLDALWGKAEIKRRAHKYKEAQALLSEILKQNPNHVSSLISLAYIRYKDDKLNEASELINRAINASSSDKENEALAYMMLGTINSRRSAKGWFFSKIRYGTQIKCYFLKAKELAPHLPEVHLGLGTFYLKAPAIVGGNLDKAVEELEAAVRIAPDFATANARLAQAYKKKGNLEKYNFYIQRARELDSQNEVLKELQ
jgi:tetratricopeptide (TPR) repeat protein